MKANLITRKNALLVLEDGEAFYGKSFGAEGETFGEAVFSTSMSGYQETLTDPSYHRQVVIATAPHIGNTGWNDEDGESGQIWVAGYVVRDPSPRPSNWRSSRPLEDELVAQNIVGICDIDTRALTRHIRERGALRIGISTTDTDYDSLLAKVCAQPIMAGQELASAASTNESYVVDPEGEEVCVVAAVDLGIKTQSPTQMAKRGMKVHVLPSDITYEEIKALNPDGLFFSNGPGDPATADGPVSVLQQALSDGLPFFGICFGNQVFGRALGFGTYKLKYGHRGINQPVVDRTTGKVEITAHNHGFAVDAPIDAAVDTPYGQASVSHLCLNDQVVEGLQLHKDGQLVGFSVQYHPEAAAGPHDANYLFDRFLDMIKANRKGA